MIPDWAELPAAYQGDNIFSALSIDAQIYYRCEACGAEYRLSQGPNIASAPYDEGAACWMCGDGSLSLLIHQAKLELGCRNCHQQWMIVTNWPTRTSCPACGSVDLDSKEKIIPEFPPACYGILAPMQNYELLAALQGNDVLAGMAGHHLWGHDVNGDMDYLEAETRRTYLVVGATKDIKHLVPLILFMQRLYRCNTYDPSESWQLMNAAGVLLRDLYRDTGQISAGIDAIEIFRECLSGIASRRTRAMVEHNIAMAAFSLLAKRQPEIYMSERAEKYLTIGIEAARMALEGYRASSETVHTRIQIARVHHVLGDLIAVHRGDKDALAEAVRYYDLAIAEPGLPEQLRDFAKYSRSIAMLLLQQLTADVAQEASEPLESFVRSEASPPIQRVTILLNMALARKESQGAAAAIPLLKQAVLIAQEQIDSARDEAAAEQTANGYCDAFYAMAGAHASLHEAKGALASIESIRALPVRFSREPPEAQGRRAAEAVVSTYLRKLLVADLLRTEDVESGAVERLDLGLAELARTGWPEDTAIWVISTSAYGMTNILVWLDHQAGWRFSCSQAQLDTTLWTLLLVPERMPTLVRETNILADFSKPFAPEIARELGRSGIRRVAVSAPGEMAHFPYEAMPIEGGIFGTEFEVFHLPSIVLAASLSVDAARKPFKKALAVKYGGADLPMVLAEINHMRSLWGNQLDVLDGSRITKRDVLDSLTGDYDLVHFSCHGSFNASNPLESALYLDTNSQIDNKRITAADLLTRGFSRRPLVTLSACSSALTSYGHASTLTGLTGSFLRMGAQGVIGSRWPVRDEVAQRCIGMIYEDVAGGSAPSRAVAKTQRRMSVDHDIEDWAAFSYLGLP